MNVRYLNSLPEGVELKRKKNDSLQERLTEFYQTNSPIMEVQTSWHYSSVESARTSWWKAIKTSGYAMRIAVPKDRDVIYIIKVDPDKL